MATASASHSKPLTQFSLAVGIHFDFATEFIDCGADELSLRGANTRCLASKQVAKVVGEAIGFDTVSDLSHRDFLQ